jgi:catechol 2,3-dioxygenase-like lactoylglutathione lyase family enzyme
MLQIKRLGHSTLTTPDLERMVDYFTRIVGLSLAAREKNKAIFATKAGLEAVVLERGSAVEAPRLSFQIAPETDLDELASRLRKVGLESERRSDITPGIGEAVVFNDTKGTTLEIFSDFIFTPEDNTFNGIMPQKFGHIAYRCPDVQEVVKFYCDVLGFRISDWRGDFFAFLRCSRDHHTLNFLRSASTAVSHLAFEVRDWSEIKRACDLLAHSNIKLTWGPIRHIIGHNIAIYHKNPDGVVIEFFCDLDQIHDEELGFFEPRPWHQDRPQRPKVWDDETPSNWWDPESRNPARGEASAAKPTGYHSNERASTARAPASLRENKMRKKNRKSAKRR